MADASGGGVLAPGRTVHDCPDHEDNLVLDLAAEVGALVVVSGDADLTSMSPWRGVPIRRAREFVGRVDAMRRHRRR
jgi:predicted nucleic acid-binding protein